MLLQGSSNDFHFNEGRKLSKTVDGQNDHRIISFWIDDMAKLELDPHWDECLIRFLLPRVKLGCIHCTD